MTDGTDGFRLRDGSSLAEQLANSRLMYDVGDEVRAFHPGMLGVVKYGRIVRLGTKYARIDFGAMLNGYAKHVNVAYRDIVEKV